MVANAQFRRVFSVLGVSSLVGYFWFFGVLGVLGEL